MAEGVFLGVLTVLVAILAAVNFMPFFPDLQPAALNDQRPSMNGPLAVNEVLESAEVLWPELIAPESIEWFEGSFYTGTIDGKIHRLTNGKRETLIDWECNWNEHSPVSCSRPLGLRMDKRTKELYVADAFRGVYKFNLASGDVVTIFDSSIPVNGKTSLLPDDVVITRSGDIYFTDASTKWDYNAIFLDCSEIKPNGRILHHNPKTKITKVAVDNLYFPNGIALSPNEDYLIFSETSMHRIRRFYIDGPKKGQLDVFAAGLPGYPDNIRASGRNTFWVALCVSWTKENPGLADFFAPYPQLKTLFMRIPYLFVLPLGVTDYLGLTSDALNGARHKVMGLLMSFGAPRHDIVIEVDQSGNIIRSLHSPNGSSSYNSQVTELEGSLYIGSFLRKGIRKIRL